MSTALTPFRVLWRRRMLERSCRWSRAELERHQQRMLAGLRQFAQRRSRFYQRFHRGLDGRPLSELPILTKPMMMEHFDELVTDPSLHLSDADAFLRTSPGDSLLHDRYVVLSTSGSTGLRGIFVFDPDEWITVLAMIARPLAWAGVRHGFRRPPRAALIASTTPWHYSTRVSRAFANRLIPSLRLDASEPLESIVSRLNDWQPEALGAYPSVLRQLAEEQIAGRLRVDLRSISTSAEMLPDDTRRRVHQAWGIRVFDTYGATEYAPIAAECPQGRKHLFEDGAIIEIVDEAGRPVPDGERGARLLITVFNRRTQPLIRYEISDMVKPLAGACDCGRPFRLIESIEGRVEDILLFPARDGSARSVAIHPNAFHQVLESVPADGWQVEQQGDGVQVWLARPRDLSASEPLVTRLRQTLEAQGAQVGPILVTPVDVLRRGATGKAPLIVARPDAKKG